MLRHQICIWSYLRYSVTMMTKRGYWGPRVIFRKAKVILTFKAVGQGPLMGTLFEPLRSQLL